MPPRRYASLARRAAAAETKARLLAAATRLLRKAPRGGVSLEAVAKAAGVSRLTVYNQFGSRRALFEAVFDERAGEGGLFRLAEAVNDPDPRAGLDRAIEIFCDFWSFDPSVGRLHRIADPELAEAVGARNERRRRTIAELVQRINAKPADDGATRDVVDLLFALTSYAMFDMLLVDGRGAAEVGALIKKICAAALSFLQNGERRA